MARKWKDPHVGGEQLPLITPDSGWKRIAELPDLRRTPRLAIDSEQHDGGLEAGRGSGWATGRGYTVGVSIAWDGGAFYAPTRHPDTDNFPQEQVAQWIADHDAAGVRFITHNASHDWGWLVTEWGIRVPERIDDTIGMAMIVDENRLSYKLDDVCRWLGVRGKDTRKLREAEAAYGFQNIMKKMHKVPARYVGEYAEQDAAALLGVEDGLLPRMQAEDTYDAYRLEMDLIPMCLEMRRRGIRVDLDQASREIDELTAMRDATLAELREKLGESRVGMDEIRSHRWLERAHDAHRIKYGRTKTGMGSFKAQWMLKHEHWLPRLVARADMLDEMANKFVAGFIVDYAHRGRLHATINQYRGEDGGGTRSYRFSYSDPGLQQMPSRNAEMKRRIRGLFLPEEGDLWLAADYSQQEYRLIVHFAQILGMPRAHEAVQQYVDDPATDFHSMVAEMTGLERKPAKDTNFAKAFGAGVGKFALMTGMTKERAAEVMDQYDQRMPFVKALAGRMKSLADRRGWVRLLDGARSHFDQWEPSWREEGETYSAPRPLEAARQLWGDDRRLRRAFTHKAMNRLIQGSAARQTKMAMRACWKEGLVPLLQMHDELDFSVNSPSTGERVAEIMRDVVRLEVPMLVDAEYGPNWGAAELKQEDVEWDEAA